MPFNPFRYASVLTIGLLLFCTGSYVNEFVIERKSVAGWKATIKVLFVSLALAIGIGMISGGISHFKESPVYASYLIPLGVLVSFVSFATKNGYKPLDKQWRILILGVLVIAISLHLGLATMAARMPGANTGGDVFKHAVK